MENALAGFSEDYRDDGNAFQLNQSFWVADSEESFNKQYALSVGMYDNTYSVEDMMKVMKFYTQKPILRNSEILRKNKNILLKQLTYL